MENFIFWKLAKAYFPAGLLIEQSVEKTGGHRFLKHWLLKLKCL